MESAILRNNLFYGVEFSLKKVVNGSWRLIKFQRVGLGGWIFTFCWICCAFSWIKDGIASESAFLILPDFN